MSDDPVIERIRESIRSHDVVLFMKGTPSFPQCGFSSHVIQILSGLGVQFKSVNVLEDDAVREGIKTFSDWPTIPQLYVKSEFVGGRDIIHEMEESGELRAYLNEKGIAMEAA